VSVILDEMTTPPESSGQGDTNMVGNVQILCQKQNFAVPTYTFRSLNQNGPFECVATLWDGTSFAGQGQGKKQAKQNAAKMSFYHLMESVPTHSTLQASPHMGNVGNMGLPVHGVPPFVVSGGSGGIHPSMPIPMPMPISMPVPMLPTLPTTVPLPQTASSITGRTTLA
jgi:hypothetical protein